MRKRRAITAPKIIYIQRCERTRQGFSAQGTIVADQAIGSMKVLRSGAQVKVDPGFVKVAWSTEAGLRRDGVWHIEPPDADLQAEDFWWTRRRLIL